MKLRAIVSNDEFDGLTADDIRKIRGAAAENVTPGLEGLAHRLRLVKVPVTEAPKKRKRGIRSDGDL